MYFNVYVYNTITGNTTVIASMVAFSAITATLTTLFMGALSDKVGKRKIFICAGYIIWGFTTFAFSLITVHNTSVLFPAANAVMLAGVFVVIMDCVMTFFGSTANDAAFNAWITDVTEPQNRGKNRNRAGHYALARYGGRFWRACSADHAGKMDTLFCYCRRAHVAWRHSRPLYYQG